MIETGTESMARRAGSATVRCRVAAWSVVSADAASLAQWRRAPGSVAGQALPASFLRQAEDQTVAALRAVLDAIERHALVDVDWTDWGVIAGPTFPGRTAIAQTIQRYASEGAWCVSPHVIPHHSLHGVSGTISQALKMHGLNFGVGGGANPGPDALLAAASLVATVPGLWLVLTGHETELIPKADGAAPPRCQAVALTLTNAPSGELALSIGPAEDDDHLPEFQLASFAKSLPSGAGRWRLSDTHRVQLESPSRRREVLA